MFTNIIYTKIEPNTLLKSEKRPVLHKFGGFPKIEVVLNNHPYLFYKKQLCSYTSGK